MIELNQQEINDLMDMLESKIRKSTYQTKVQNQEDLEQELKLKILEKAKNLVIEEPPGFWDFRNNIMSHK